MASTAQFIANGFISAVVISGANAALDGSGSITELAAGVAGGLRILEIIAKNADTSVVAQVNVFLSTNGGATWRLFDQLAIAAATVSASTASSRISRSYANLILANENHRIGVATTIAQATNVIALGGPFVA